jgi:2-dehydro-3-deoxyphosphooctonate aldolase (KDO 8-P synthase)
MVRSVPIAGWKIGSGGDFLVVAGPCVIESEKHAMKMADCLKQIVEEFRVPFLFKASYDKANRTALSSYRGPGLQEGLRVLEKIRSEVGVKVLSDVHNEQEVHAAAEVLDVLQTPAFLCRQTDFLLAVARVGKPMNVKKAQFLAPWDMENVVNKILSAGNDRILLTERGVCFGYNQLVSDMRSLVILRRSGCPVLFDATHSVQTPGGLGNASGGEREFIVPLARAAVAVGVDGLFVEVHDVPDRALSDGPNSLPLERFPFLLDQVLNLHARVREWEERGLTTVTR